MYVNDAKKTLDKLPRELHQQKIKMEPDNHRCEKETHSPETSISGFQPLFEGVHTSGHYQPLRSTSTFPSAAARYQHQIWRNTATDITLDLRKNNSYSNFILVNNDHTSG